MVYPEAEGRPVGLEGPEGVGGEVREVAKGGGSRKWAGSYRKLGDHSENFGFSSESHGSRGGRVLEQSQDRI